MSDIIAQVRRRVESPDFDEPLNEIDRLRALSGGEDLDFWKHDADALLEYLTALLDRIEELEKALERQCDNIAFVINHVTLPDSWHEKFQCELEIARAALDQDKVK